MWFANLSFEHGKSETRFIEEKRTFEPENIGPNIQLHMNRCILFTVVFADQLTDDRVHGVMDRGIILIYLLVSQKQLIMSFLEIWLMSGRALTDKQI
jgi:hypothetical protein